MRQRFDSAIPSRQSRKLDRGDDFEDDDRVIAVSEAHVVNAALLLSSARVRDGQTESRLEFRSGGEVYPLQRSRGDGDDDAEAAAVVMVRSRSGHRKGNPFRATRVKSRRYEERIDEERDSRSSLMCETAIDR